MASKCTVEYAAKVSKCKLSKVMFATKLELQVQSASHTQLPQFTGESVNQRANVKLCTTTKGAGLWWLRHFGRPRTVGYGRANAYSLLFPMPGRVFRYPDPQYMAPLTTAGPSRRAPPLAE